MKRLLLIVLFMTFAGNVFAQKTKDPGVHTDKYTLEHLSSTSTTFTINATGNDTSKVYRIWPFMTLALNVTSSGTVEFNTVFQAATPAFGEGNGDVSNWVTEKTTAISATGQAKIQITATAVSVNPGFFRIITDGQGSNHASTTAVLIFNGANPYTVRGR